MDIYEALDKLKQNKRIDRTARRKQLVEKKLAESSDKKPVKKPVKKLNESLKESLDQEQIEDTKAYVYEQATHRPNLTRDGHIEIDEYHFEDMVNDALDYEDCTEEEAQVICEELKKLIEGIKYYRASWKLYIELSDNRTLWDIDVPDGVSDAEVESVYEMMLGVAFDDFQEETGVDLTLLGRSGRHVCVDNTYENAKRYSELVSVQKEVEDRFIKNVNDELRSPNEEEYESLKESFDEEEYRKVLSDFKYLAYHHTKGMTKRQEYDLQDAADALEAKDFEKAHRLAYTIFRYVNKGLRKEDYYDLEKICDAIEKFKKQSETNESLKESVRKTRKLRK